MAETLGWVCWADTVGSGLTLLPGPKTRACWATLEQSELFCCRGSPGASPPLCPRWLPVGRRMGPGPPRRGWEHPLPKPGGLVPVIQTVVVYCWTWWQTGPLEADATLNIQLGTLLDEVTTLFEWSGQAWIACLLSRSAGRGCDVPWGLLAAWCTRTEFSTVGHTESPISSPLLCWYIGNHCCVVCSYQHCLVED